MVCLMGKDKKSGKKPEYWLKWKNVEKEMKNIIKKNDKNFPTLQELRRLDYENQDIEKAIMRHGLTLDEVRIKMGIKAPESSSKDKMLQLLEASTDSFLSNVKEVKEERQQFLNKRRAIKVMLDDDEDEDEDEFKPEINQSKPRPIPAKFVSPPKTLTPPKISEKNPVLIKPEIKDPPTIKVVPDLPKTHEVIDLAKKDAVPDLPKMSEAIDLTKKIESSEAPKSPQIIDLTKQVTPPELSKMPEITGIPSAPTTPRPAPPKAMGEEQTSFFNTNPPPTPVKELEKSQEDKDLDELTSRLKAFKEKLKKFDV